ncbi:regulatory protein RecX [Senegalimassilia sp.]
MPYQAAPSIEELKRRIRQIENSPSADAQQSKGKTGSRSRAKQPNQVSRKRMASMQSNEYDSLGQNSSKDVPEALTEEQAFRKIERLVCMREQASKALQTRLEKDGFDPQVAQAAIKRALRCGLISDERFADVLVRSRLSQGRGLQGIAAELVTLDIEPYSVTAYLEATEGQTGPDELARALAFLDAKPPRGKRLRDSAYRKLMQKGYGASVSASAARIWSEEHETDNSLQAEF